MRHRIALTVIVALLVAGCTASVEDASSVDPIERGTSDGTAADDDASDVATGEVSVSIGDFFFAPDERSVAVGDTVTWTHDGDITHNVTARDGSFTSDDLASGESFSHTFAEAGSFAYRCTLHGQMLATIDVS